MRVIYNRHFPFGHYWAINLCGVIFARRDFGRLGPRALRHEYIHTLQQRELLFVFFFLLYGLEWLVRLLQYRNLFRAYRNISFEREAYSNEGDVDYPSNRSFWNWARYITK